MNFVFIMTDTQNREMVGAYGIPDMNTPNLDRLCEEGTRFNRGYTCSPVCTPARGSIFTGLHSQCNGAIYNSATPMKHVPDMGALFQREGYRTAYTGKWHLDGGPYMGDGVPAPGFEPEWWYDGQTYIDEFGEEFVGKQRKSGALENKIALDLPEEKAWGTRVADRAIDFLETVKDDEKFVLCVSFDEPHGPFMCPKKYYDMVDLDELPIRPNFNAEVGNKPELQQLHAAMHNTTKEDLHAYMTCFYACNMYIDRQIGRVIDAVDKLHKDDTCIIYTSDHGEMKASHGQWGKGPIMYEEVTNVPFIIRAPGFEKGQASPALASHIDIIPTMYDLAGLSIPEKLQGVSLKPVLEDPISEVRDHCSIAFHRFGDMPPQGGMGNFYPIRCIVDERFKLAINLFETDEFYDLAEDPYEMENLIDDERYFEDRDRLHDLLLDEMDETLDFMRSYKWGQRSWRNCREKFYKKPKT